MPLFLNVDYQDIDLVYYIYLRYYGSLHPSIMEVIYGKQKVEAHVHDHDNKKGPSKSESKNIDE